MDDSPLILEAAREALESAGFAVETASNLAEFEAQMGLSAPDLIILDVEMPEMFGDHVATVLRHIRGMKMPIYLFSTRSQEELASRVEEAQVDGYIAKDEGVEGLVTKVRAVLGPKTASGRPKAKHRVVVVDDSHIARAVLIDVLQADGDIEVVGQAEDGYKALETVERLKPDVVTMDVSMPGVDGLQTLSWIMAKCPVPVLLVTEEPLGHDMQLAFEAMQRGAVDLIPKTFGTLREVGERFREMVRRAAWTPVFLRDDVTKRDTLPPTDSAKHMVAKYMEEEQSKVAVIAIAAGSGGTQVVTRTLSQLPVGLPCVVLVTQPIPGGYESAYAQFLRSKISLPVAVVPKGGVDCVPGTVYIAGEDAHLVALAPGRVGLKDGPREHGCRPSGDVLFRSVAEVYGDRALGVVVSGRGIDGTAGLRAMREKGAQTIAEQPDMASPSEMPKCAATSGAAESVIETAALAETIEAIVKPKTRGGGPPSSKRQPPVNTKQPPSSARTPWSSPVSRGPGPSSRNPGAMSKTPSMSIAGRPPSTRSPAVDSKRPGVESKPPTMVITPRPPPMTEGDGGDGEIASSKKRPPQGSKREP